MIKFESPVSHRWSPISQNVSWPQNRELGWSPVVNTSFQTVSVTSNIRHCSGAFLWLKHCYNCLDLLTRLLTKQMSLSAIQKYNTNEPFRGCGGHACTKVRLLCTCHVCHRAPQGCLELLQPGQCYRHSAQH